MNRSLRIVVPRLACAVLLSTLLSAAAQTRKTPPEKQWPVQQGKLVVSGDKLVYFYKLGTNVVVPISIPVADITDLDFSRLWRTETPAQQTEFPDWGPGIEQVGPVVNAVDLTQTDKEYLAIQWVEDNQTKGLVLEVPKKHYAGLANALRRITAPRSTAAQAPDGATPR